MFKKKNLILKFLFIVVSSVSLFLVFSSFVIYAYKENQPKPQVQIFTDEETGAEIKVVEPEPEDKKIFKAPIKTNFLIVGVDYDELLTDVILVGNFNSETKKIKLLSIPRDTRTFLTDETIDRIKSRSNRTMEISKINGVNAAAGGNEGILYTKKEIENILKIKIDYYAIINLDAFRKIVDAVDGIEMTLDRNYYYSDPTQNLYINLKSGRQILDGKHAEMFVRYRSDYLLGDEDRIKVQQRFMKEFFNQVLNKETIINNASSFISLFLSYIRTDFGIEDAPKYLEFVNDIKGENFSFYTLPGEGKYIGEVSYFLPDYEETASLVREIFYNSDNGDVDKNDNTTSEDSKNLKIQILNGSNKNNMASKISDKLEKDGYSIDSIATYQGNKQSRTRINIKKSGLGEDLLKYFKDAKIQVDNNLPDNCDIIIILGTDE